MKFVSYDGRLPIECSEETKYIRGEICMYIDLNLSSIILASMSVALMYHKETYNNMDRKISEIRNTHAVGSDDSIYHCIRSTYVTRCSTVLFLLSYIAVLFHNLLTSNDVAYVYSIALSMMVCICIRFGTLYFMKRKLRQEGLHSYKAEF